jgi:hypothetical protein
VLLSTPLHVRSSSNFTTFANVFVQLANKRGLQKTYINKKSIVPFDDFVVTKG